jgi:hypothetical protein
MIRREVRTVLMLTALTSQPAFAQSLAITGRVNDEAGTPLPGVTVQLRAAAALQAETVTDTAGHYRLGAVGEGAHELRFSLVNFDPVTKQLALTAGRAVVIDAVLPLAFRADVTVTGHGTFRNLADIERPTESLIGLARAASEGAVTARQLEHRPLLRPGEVLETVPGLVISQHSGEGKANQYFLRGFNLDHGTDFAVTVAGIPVNMPTHGHAQGWSDVNFLIPELVSGIQFRKGPYFAEEGDFSTAGAANVNYVSFLNRPLVRLTVGATDSGASSPLRRPGWGPAVSSSPWKPDETTVPGLTASATAG